jgi:hypothetical protein
MAGNIGFVLASPQSRRYPSGPSIGPLLWAHSSAVEHYLDMVGVTGSIPVAPTNLLMLWLNTAQHQELEFSVAKRHRIDFHISQRP